MRKPLEVMNDEILRQLHEKRAGLIYNDFSGLGVTGGSYNVLHSAGCRWVAQSNTKVRKLFFHDLIEATSWLMAERGAENARWKRCRTCSALDVPAGATMAGFKQSRGLTEKSARVSELKPVKNDFVPFNEARVEKNLVSWFEGQNFTVQMRFVVPSGIIDFIALRGEEVWVIEAKGEDRGGYNSAEMNFRVGIGQISSRMAGFEDAYFGVAIPFTKHFARVLRKFAGSSAFEKLKLWLFIVHEDGSVARISPDATRSYIANLS